MAASLHQPGLNTILQADHPDELFIFEHEKAADIASGILCHNTDRFNTERAF